MMSKLQLVTKRTTLRIIDYSDIESIHRLHSFQQVDEYNTLGIPENLNETKSIVEPWIAENELATIQNYTLAIENKINKEFIGLFGLKQGAEKFKRAEVWCKLHVDYWNSGIATEVLKRMLAFGFDELGLHRIEAGCAVDNVQSIKVLEKVGMSREGRRREILPLKTGWSDNFEYSILEGEYKSSKK